MGRCGRFGAQLRCGGGAFCVIRNNSINHNIKQKPLRGKISKLARHRARPTADPQVASPGLSSAAGATDVSHKDGGGRQQIQQDSCRDSGLEMLSFNAEQLDVFWEFIQMALFPSHLPCR